MAMAIAVEQVLKGREVIWASPTYDQSRIGWQETQRANSSGLLTFHESRHVCSAPNGKRIIYRSLEDADNVRGYTADYVIVDEAPFCKDGTWHQVLRPMLSDTGGGALLMGTPKGRNWFWREIMAARDREDSATFQAPTLGVHIVNGELLREPHPLENTEFSFAEARQMFDTLPERIFSQEFLAEFIDDAGGVFRRVRSCATSIPLMQGLPNRHYVIGCDWGKHNDWTVLTVWDPALRRQVALDRFNKIDYVVQLDRLRALYTRFPGQVIAESNAMGEALIERLQRDGIPVVPFSTTNASKSSIIEALQIAFERGLPAILPDETQIAEFEAFECTRLPGGLMRYSAPGGMHDDTVMANALAWSAVRIESFNARDIGVGVQRETFFDLDDSYDDGWSRYTGAPSEL